MYRVIAAILLAGALVFQALGIASAFERSLGNLRDDAWVTEKSLGNLRAPVGPGIDSRLLEFTAPEFLAPLPARQYRNACMAGCTYCRDGCTWHWRTNCFGDQCEPQFAQCMDSCWLRSCQTCRSGIYERAYVYERVDIEERAYGIGRIPFSPRPFK